MSFDHQSRPSSQPDPHEAEQQPTRHRRPYTKPSVQTVVINSKSDVLGVNCFTSTNTSQMPGNGCRNVPAVCFS